MELINKEEEEGLDFNYEDSDKLEKYSRIKIYHESKKNNDLLQSKKGHLIYFLPLFSECIVSKENELKELLREIFKEVAKELGLDSI